MESSCNDGTRRNALRLLGAALATATGMLPGAQAAGSADARPAAMLRRLIPSSGESLGIIGCGTWQTFDVGTGKEERAELAAVLRILFEHGGSAIDSSPMYGRSEQVVGDLLEQNGWQKQAFVATKVWTSGRDAGIRQMQESMRLLRDDRVELMQVHNLVDWRTHLKTLRSWKESGRIRYLGITHYTESAYEELERILRAEKLDFVQLNYSIAEREAERRLLPLAAERGVAVLINQPFGGGRLLRELSSRPLPSLAAELDCSSWAQLLLKFVVSHAAVTCAIPGTGKARHMTDNCRAGIGMLPNESQRQRIAQAWQG